MNHKILSNITVFTRKDKKYLRTCLISLEKSAHKASRKLEIILIANGTTHENYGFLNSKVKKITLEKNIGFASAVNIGMKSVRGEWCTVVCPDVITDINCISKILPFLDDQKTAIVAPKILDEKNKIQPNILSVPTLTSLFLEQSFLYKLLPGFFRSPQAYLPLYLKTRKVDAIAAIWWMINKNAFIDSGKFDGRFFLYFEDVELCIRLKKRGFNLIYEPEAQVLHLPHRSTGGITSGKLYYQSLQKILSKYHGPVYTEISLQIFRLGCHIRILYWKLNSLLSLKYDTGAKQKIIFLRDILHPQPI